MFVNNLSEGPTKPNKQDGDDFGARNLSPKTSVSFFRASVTDKVIKMSPLFSIIGDSNIRRNMTGLNIASRSSMKSAQIIDCVSLATIE